MDVALRYGISEYTLPKWRAVLGLKDYFDEKAGTGGNNLIRYLPERPMQKICKEIVAKRETGSYNMNSVNFWTRAFTRTGDNDEDFII